MSTSSVSLEVRDRLYTAAEIALGSVTSHWTSVGTRDNSLDVRYSRLRYAETYELEDPSAAPTLILELATQTYRFGGPVDSLKFIETLAGIK